MAKYIDADKLKRAIAKLSENEYNDGTLGDDVANGALDYVILIINRLQQEESISDHYVRMGYCDEFKDDSKRKEEQEQPDDDLDKEIETMWKKCNPVDEGMGVESTYMHIEAFDIIARHFAEWGSEHLKK